MSRKPREPVGDAFEPFWACSKSSKITERLLAAVGPAIGSSSLMSITQRTHTVASP
ncbi:BQ5605_C007g04733 [Microbotryum silenes-dioicae]|uniref:BQ5605_C007g04733 protein n=1 Tax=Microbotryum silenes-dioicae TaxID=796604 RepID=A0A2X0P9X2_9BASI|nr:BQ5605_C007g04733 [Microbotryum silenes-dioicae]